jgi:hypothetical protein
MPTFHCSLLCQLSTAHCYAHFPVISKSTKILVLLVAVVEARSSGGNISNPVFVRLPHTNTVLQTFVTGVSLAGTYIEFKYEIPNSYVYTPKKFKPSKRN